MPVDAPTRPDPPRDSPVRLSREEWRLILVRTAHEFRYAKCWDIASALTYYVVLATVPAALATLALLALFDSADDLARELLAIVEAIGGETIARTLEEPLAQLVDASNAGFAFALGLGVALWSVSGYLGVFGRGMNTILGVEEGRPFWRSRPAMIGVAAVVLALGAAIAAGVLLSGPFAGAVARAAGIDDGLVPIWDVVKIPVLAALAGLVIAILYWATPNVHRESLRWISVGAASALVAWVVTTFAFLLYVTAVATYQRVYGVLGGVLAFLLWVWLSNLAVLAGAVLDTEVERTRQLRIGIRAEDRLQLRLRDESMLAKNRVQRADDVRRSAALAPGTAVDGMRRPDDDAG